MGVVEKKKVNKNVFTVTDISEDKSKCEAEEVCTKSEDKEDISKSGAKEAGSKGEETPLKSKKKKYKKENKPTINLEMFAKFSGKENAPKDSNNPLPEGKQLIPEKDVAGTLSTTKTEESEKSSKIQK